MSTQLRTVDTTALANLNKAFIGFDRILNSRFMNTNYPPHNIVKYDDDHYAIEVAVAGFNKNEISVSVDQDKLSIIGNREDAVVDDNREYLHRGLAARNFEQNFTLAEYMEIRGATVENGLLRIFIERVIPESMKPRKIEIM